VITGEVPLHQCSGELYKTCNLMMRNLKRKAMYLGIMSNEALASQALYVSICNGLKVHNCTQLYWIKHFLYSI